MKAERRKKKQERERTDEREKRDYLPRRLATACAGSNLLNFIAFELDDKKSSSGV